MIIITRHIPVRRVYRWMDILPAVNMVELMDVYLG